jgi:hypothetical protein
MRKCGCHYAKMSTPGVEPGLSRPQRDVLTTRRCGLLRVVHLGGCVVGWAGQSINERSARVSPVPSIVAAAVCACCVSFQINGLGFRDALTGDVDVYPLQPNFRSGGLWRDDMHCGFRLQRSRCKFARGFFTHWPRVALCALAKMYSIASLQFVAMSSGSIRIVL